MYNAIIAIFLLFFISGCTENVSSILKAVADPNSNAEILLMLDQPEEKVTLRSFDLTSKQYTDIANISNVTIHSLNDMAIDSKRNQALISIDSNIFGVDLATGVISIISSRTVGVGPVIDPQWVIYNEITDTAIIVDASFNRSYQGSINSSVIYSLNLTNGDRTELGQLGYYMYGASLDAVGRRLYAYYDSLDMGVLVYDLATGTETVLVDTANKIGQYDLFDNSPLPGWMSKNISYSATRNELFLVFSQQILVLDVATGVMRAIGEQAVNSLSGNHPFKNAHVVNDSLIMSRAYYRDNLAYVNQDSNYLYSYDLNTDQIVNLEKGRLNRETPTLASINIITYLVYRFLSIFG